MLAELENELNGAARNYHMAFALDQSRLCFLYKLERGPCANSYGFHVAQLSGIPQHIVERAISKSLSVQSTNQRL